MNITWPRAVSTNRAPRYDAPASETHSSAQPMSRPLPTALHHPGSFLSALPSGRRPLHGTQLLW